SKGRRGRGPRPAQKRRPRACQMMNSIRMPSNVGTSTNRAGNSCVSIPLWRCSLPARPIGPSVVDLLSFELLAHGRTLARQVLAELVDHAAGNPLLRAVE